MRQKEVELLCAYFLNYGMLLEEDVNQLRQRLRFEKNIGVLDCTELQLALNRQECFNEFARNVKSILSLSGVKFEEEEE